MRSALLFTLVNLLLASTALPYSPKAQVNTYLLRRRLQDTPSRSLTARSLLPSPSFCTGENALYDTDSMTCGDSYQPFEQSDFSDLCSVCPAGLRVTGSDRDISCQSCLGDLVLQADNRCACPVNQRPDDQVPGRCICIPGATFVEGACSCPIGTVLSRNQCLTPSCPAVLDNTYFEGQLFGNGMITCLYLSETPNFPFDCVYNAATGNFMSGPGRCPARII